MLSTPKKISGPVVMLTRLTSQTFSAAARDYYFQQLRKAVKNRNHADVTVRSPRQTECGECGFTNVARRRTLSLINAASPKCKQGLPGYASHFSLLFWRTRAWLLGILPKQVGITHDSLLTGTPCWRLVPTPYSSHPGRRKNPGLLAQRVAGVRSLNFVREHQPAKQWELRKAPPGSSVTAPVGYDMSPACVALKTYRGRSG